jgi:hypothetical protein
MTNLYLIQLIGILLTGAGMVTLTALLTSSASRFHAMKDIEREKDETMSLVYRSILKRSLLPGYV